MATLQELLEQRNKHVSDAQALFDKAGKEKREMNAEENVQFTRLMDEGDKLKKEIDSLDASQKRSARLASAQEELAKSRGRGSDPADPAGPKGDEPRNGERAVEIRGKRFVFKPGTPEHRRAGPEYREGVAGYLRGETRALQTDLDIAGGYLTMQEQFVSELLKDVDDEVYIRQLARKFLTSANSIGVPRRTSKLASAVWGSELGAPTADTALKFGKRALTPHYMTASILVSNDLMRSSVMDPEAMVREEIARDTGELEERAFLTGTGSQQPLGVFTASADGISTARDVSTGNTSSAITFDGLISAVYALKQAYRKTAAWMFHRNAMAAVRKLKDSQNQYLWQPSTQAGQPDRLLNMPVTESEWVPSTFTTGLYVGILADWTKYWIVDSLALDIKRLDELNARTNQVEFIARRKVDGAPTIEEAFVRVTLA